MTSTADDEVLRPFGSRLRSRRQQAGLTQLDLARSAGVSLATVRDLEQLRSRRPRASTVRALAAVLGLTAAEVVGLRALPDEPGAPHERTGNGPVLSVLGPLALQWEGRPLTPGSPGQRTLLGLLALHPGTVVSRARIVDALWPQLPPERAANVIQTHVARLRRLLRPVTDSGVLAIRSSTGGYQLEAGPEGLDLVAFEHLLDLAREHRSDPQHCVALLDRALDLWRGDPLADVEALAGQPAVQSLTERRSAAVLDLAAAADLAGRPELALPRLRECARRHPLNEPVHVRLVAALARSGDQAGALEVYERVRRSLAEELGIHPGEELRQVHGDVLRQQLGVAVPPARTADPVVDAEERAGPQAPPPQAPPPVALAAVPAEAPPRRPRRRWIWAPVLAAAVLLGSLPLWPVRGLGEREAARTTELETRDPIPPDTCIKRIVEHLDGRRPGRVFSADFECQNAPGAPLHASPDGTSPKISVMLTTRSWFLCWVAGAVRPDGERVWYYTQGDTNEPGTERYGAWGYVSAAALNLADHPYPGMPHC